jgi:3-methyladenine DNA glycosylase AlkD
MVGQALNVDAEVAAIRAELEARADPSYVDGMRRTVPSALPAHAVRVPELRKVTNAWLRRHRDAAPEEVLAVAEELWSTHWREEGCIAIALLADVQQLATSEHSWQRRLAIVTLIEAARKEPVWTPHLEAMAARLKGDRGPTLRKAVAWANRVLRELEARS